MSSECAGVAGRRRLLTLALIVSFALATRGARADVSVDIQPDVNANIQTYTDGSHYPPGGTTLTNGGVSFTLAYFDPTKQTGTGVIQTPGGTTSSYDLAVNVANPTAVDTLINSAYGSFGSTVGSIEFKATGGLDYTVNLVEGQDIRDHFNDGFNNTIGTGALGSIYVHTFEFDTGDTLRLDQQHFVLPTSFNSATLTDIILHGAGGYPQGEPFLAAATVLTGTTAVPEPSSLVTMGLVVGMGSAWGWRRRRRGS